MAAATFFNQFHEDLPHGVHNLGSDALTIALVASANTPVVTNSILGDLTEIAYTNVVTSGAGDRVITVATSEGTDGSYELALTDLIITATGGAVAPFRYIVIFNDTPTSPVDPLIMFYDYGSDLTLNENETLTLDFAANTITM